MQSTIRIRITPAFYEEKLKEYSTEKENWLKKLRQVSETDDIYYQQVFGIVELASKAYELFGLSNPEEKQELINIVSLKNVVVNGKVQVTLATPFSYFSKIGKSPTMGQLLDQFLNREIGLAINTHTINRLLSPY